MDLPKIARKADGTPRHAMPSRLVSWIFATHLGTLIAIPGLVLAVGACFVVLGQKSLGESISASTGGRTLDLSDGFARSGAVWAAGAGSVLTELARQVAAHPTGDAQFLAVSGGGLLAGHPEVADATIAWPDGSALRFTRDGAAVQSRGIERWVPEPDADGRTEWFNAAAQDGGARWSPPDPPGMPARRARGALAVRDSAGTRIATVCVGLDLGRTDAGMRELAASIVPARPPDRAGETHVQAATAMQGPLALALLFRADGRLVASSADPADAGAASLSAAALPAVTALLNEPPPQGAAPGGTGRIIRRLTLAGEEYVVGIKAVPDADAPGWHAAALVRTDRVSAPAQAHLHRSLMIGMVVLAVSVGLSFLLAEHLARQRRLVIAARAQAASAEERLRSLGSYRLVRKLGEGGMGTVWLAEHELLARPTAVKLILPEALGTRARAIERFAREAKVTASLRSPNTVTLYDYGLSENGSFYYAMELLDGMDLETLIKLYGAQPAGRVVSILIQACRSLGEAHARGLVHRDIKTANLFLCRLGSEVDVVKVLDFGLVAAASDELRSEFVQGTPAFMPPEQARAQPVDARSDLYALGCVAYWLLCDRPPFTAADPQAMMMAHIGVPPPPLDPSVPRPLAELVLALLEKQPSRRPASAEAVLAALTALDASLRPTWSAADASAWWEARPAAPPASVEPTDESPIMLVRTGIGGVTVG